MKNDQNITPNENDAPSEEPTSEPVTSDPLPTEPAFKSPKPKRDFTITMIIIAIFMILVGSALIYRGLSPAPTDDTDQTSQNGSDGQTDDTDATATLRTVTLSRISAQYDPDIWSWSYGESDYPPHNGINPDAIVFTLISNANISANLMWDVSGLGGGCDKRPHQ